MITDSYWDDYRYFLEADFINQLLRKEVSSKNTCSTGYDFSLETEEKKVQEMEKVLSVVQDSCLAFCLSQTLPLSRMLVHKLVVRNSDLNKPSENQFKALEEQEDDPVEVIRQINPWILLDTSPQTSMISTTQVFFL